MRWRIAPKRHKESIARDFASCYRRVVSISSPSISRLHSPLTAWQLRSRFITCTRPRLRTQGNKRDLICCFLGHLKRSSHLLILSSLSTSSSSPTRKALVLTPPASNKQILASTTETLQRRYLLLKYLKNDEALDAQLFDFECEGDDQGISVDN